MSAGPKKLRQLKPETPIQEAIRAQLKVRVDAIGEKLAAASAEGKNEPRNVHELRVATRRAGVVLRAFEPWLTGRAWRRLTRTVRELRRAAAVARDLDVHLQAFAEMHDAAPGALSEAIELLSDRLSERRAEAHSAIVQIGQTITQKSVRAQRRRVIDDLREEDAGVVTLGDAAKRIVGEVVARARAAAGEDLSDLAKLHELRLAIKRVRYTAEVFRPCLGEGFENALEPKIIELQDRLGEVNDSDTLLVRIRGEIEALGADGVSAESSVLRGLRTLEKRVELVRDQRRAKFLGYWRDVRFDDLMSELAAAAGGVVTEAVRITPETSHPLEETRRVEASRAPVPGILPAVAAREGAPGEERRIAAIDVGSNSIRLVIAEAHSDGTYRVLDDEKDAARLGRGLVFTGRLDHAAMEHGVLTIARMKGIAEGYGVRAVRVAATAAVREAENGGEFVQAVRQRTGLEMKIISAEEEARLAYLSVANAFGDFRTLNAAIVDVGGGSAQIVLCSAGVIDEVRSLPLGAVRLTEGFGGSKAVAGDRHKELREHVRALLREHVPEPAAEPDLMIGTGGTITSLGQVVLGKLGDKPAAAPGSVQGFQMKRAQVDETLEWLRETPVASLAAARGLSADRADIFVAGVTVVREIMKHLGVKRLRVHERGIRDGLLLTAIAEEFGTRATSGEASADRMEAVRRFARACRYEERHSEHVAKLALEIFDQLSTLPGADGAGGSGSSGAWATLYARGLLEASAVLHDVGYIINYAKHHKHSYHLIKHAELPGFSPEEIEVVANVARYHRRAEPGDRHAGFAALSEDQKELVLRLSAILRIADGLDRTHTQHVTGVTVRVQDEDARTLAAEVIEEAEPGEDEVEGTPAGDVQTAGLARFVVESADDPVTDVWGAARKSGLFARVFRRRPVIEWAGAEVGRSRRSTLQ